MGCTLKNRIANSNESLKMSEKYAQVAWTAADVQVVRPEMSDDEAAEWLANNAKHIQAAMVERGWEVIRDLKPSESQT
jgi:hypothetical protein